MMENRVYSFPPVVNQDTRVLVLGSMPGVKSLEQQQYYAHPRNHFWPIMFALFEQSPIVAYEQRIAWLLSKGVGLWDVMASCSRQGSLDSNIRAENVNDFGALFASYSQIERLYFNGTKAYDTFCKYKVMQRYPNLTMNKLPSTSPIPGRNRQNLAEKIAAWSIILE